MAKPEISEFSYGYAFTDELIHAHNFPLVAAPKFPSLYEEGQPDGGYDVRLTGTEFPVFIQFKLADFMTRSNAIGANCFPPRTKFYRMEIYKRSKQHDMLMQLQEIERFVYYAAPSFHETAQLNRFYINNQVLDKSLLIRPSVLGSNHDMVAFIINSPPTPNQCFLLEKDDCIPCPAFENFRQDIEDACSESADERSPEEFLDQIERSITEILIDNNIDFDGIRGIERFDKLTRIQVYSSFFMNALLFLIRRRGTEQTPNENSQ